MHAQPEMMDAVILRHDPNPDFTADPDRPELHELADVLDRAGPLMVFAKGGAPVVYHSIPDTGRARVVRRLIFAPVTIHYLSGVRADDAAQARHFGARLAAEVEAPTLGRAGLAPIVARTARQVVHLIQRRSPMP